MGTESGGSHHSGLHEELQGGRFELQDQMEQIMLKKQQVCFQPHTADDGALTVTLQSPVSADVTAQLSPQVSLQPSGNGFPCCLSTFLGGNSWTKLLLDNKQLINQ